MSVQFKPYTEDEKKCLESWETSRAKKIAILLGDTNTPSESTLNTAISEIWLAFKDGYEAAVKGKNA